MESLESILEQDERDKIESKQNKTTWRATIETIVS